MKRLWGIRHVRYLWLSFQLARWLSVWYRAGAALHASDADLAYLDAVWKGEI